MSRRSSFLFPQPYDTMGFSWIILLFRLMFGGMLLYHGIEKCIHFEEMSHHFMNFIGLGPKFSLILSIFAEVGCSLALIAGFLVRLSILPLIFNMLMATFFAMPHAPYKMMELPLIYLLGFVILYIAGPGRISIDYLILQRLDEKSRRVG